MTARSMTLTVAVVLVCQVSTAQAQRRRTLPRGPQTNPVHEQIKNQADQAYQQGNHQQVVALATQVLQEDPNDAVARYLRGSAKVELGRAQSNVQFVRDGIEDAREAIRISNNDNPDFYLPYLYGMTNLARLENKPEHAQVAVQVADQMLQQRPNLEPQQRANIYYQRGQANIAQRAFEQAANDFNESLKNVPAHFGSLVGKAEALGLAGKHTEALAAYDACIRAFQSMPLPYHNKAVYLQQRGDSDAAIAEFSRALEIDPNYFFSYTSRGIAQLDAGNAAAAEQDLTASLRLNPAQPIAQSARGDARIDQGKLEGGVQDHREAAELDPNNPVTHAKLGFACFFNGDLLEAVDAFDQALKLDRNAQHLNPWRAWSLILLDQEDVALKNYEKIFTGNIDDRTWPEHLTVYLFGRETQQELLAAISKDDQALADAQECEAWFFIASKQAREGEVDQATQNFQKAVAKNARQLAAYRGAKLILTELVARTP